MADNSKDYSSTNPTGTDTGNNITVFGDEPASSAPLTKPPTIDDHRALAEHTGKVNFLGSSYSGADIKVVAHLYDNNLADEIERLNREKAIGDQIVDGCTNLRHANLTAAMNVSGYAARRKAFLDAAQIQENQDTIEVVNILLGNIFTADGSPAGVAQMVKNASTLLSVYETMNAGTSKKLDSLNAVGAVSTKTFVIASLQTISVQSYREKNAVRACGHTFVKGYTRGARTIAGSMILTVFDEHALADLIRAVGRSDTYGEKDRELTGALADQLPPMDLTVVFANEYGTLSEMRLFGVEFQSDGMVFSIEDLLTEQVMNFVCREAEMMTAKGKISIARESRGVYHDSNGGEKSASSLRFDNGYDAYLDKIGVRRRLVNR